MRRRNNPTRALTRLLAPVESNGKPDVVSYAPSLKDDTSDAGSNPTARLTRRYNVQLAKNCFLLIGLSA